MGIKRFHKFFASGVSCIYTRKRKIGDDKETKLLGDFFGKYCVIDTYSKLYSGIIAIRSKKKELKETTIIDNSHLHVILNYTLSLLKVGLIPIYVFDGKSPNIKSETIEKRKNVREKISGKMSKLSSTEKTEDNPEFMKIFKRDFTISTKQINECKELLTYIGVPFVQSIEEGDMECVRIMETLGDKCAFVISDDTDLLVLGAKRMICNFTNHTDKTSYFDLEIIKEIFMSKINKIRSDAGKEPIKKFNYDDFVKFMVIMGTDYNKGIKTKNIDDLLSIFVLSDFDIDNMIVKLKDKETIISKSFTNNWKTSFDYYRRKNIDVKYNVDFKPLNSEKFVKILKNLQIHKKKIDTICKDLFIAHYVLTKK